MRITFHGAAREVTGSCHLLEVGGRTILLDCGLIQGGAERHERNREPFPFDPAAIDCVVLSHAHIDHSGRLALLVKNGFRGRIISTPPSCKLAEILLPDSGRIQEEDARWKIKRLRKKGEDWSWVTPLYTEEDAMTTLERFDAVDFNTPFDIDGVGRLRFVRAGHILGAAIVQLELEENGKRATLAFSGDLGVDGARLMGGPDPIPAPDYLLIESTYGNRRHAGRGDKTEQLYRIIKRTIDRGGNVVIPAFAVGRTQAVLARINDLVEAGRLKGLTVYVDSPMAVRSTGVFATFPEAYSERARRLLHAGDKPLEFPGLSLSVSVEDSKAINERRDPCVIISASGMCTAGRVKHHLKNNISDSRSSIVFVGYQARGTLGRHIQGGTDPVRIFGELYTVKADVHTIEGFSAHADQEGLLQWFEDLDGCPRRTFVVHGEEEVAVEFAEILRGRFCGDAVAPKLGQSFELEGA